MRVSEVRVERTQMLISVRADALFSVEGTMGRLAAFDLRGDQGDHLAREHALAQPPSSPPMVCPREECDGAPQPQLPGAHLVSFGYRRFSNPPLPSAAVDEKAAVEYASEITLRMAAVRGVWLQQWVVGYFDFLDDSMLAAVLRGTASLLHAPQWAPPSRRRPTKMHLVFDEPLILMPRNHLAACDEAQLSAASLWCEADRIEVTNVLRREAIPGLPDDELLLVDRVEIAFEGLRPATRLGLAPPGGASPQRMPAPRMPAPLVPLLRPGSAAALRVEMVRTIERPHALVPASLLGFELGRGHVGDVREITCEASAAHEP